MKISLEKIKGMILYFTEHTDPDFLGKTKLMKLFYFADFCYVKKHGIPMTFDRYQNREHGPIPTTIYSLITDAFTDPEESLLSDVITFEEMKRMQKIIPRKKFSEQHMKLFSVSELRVLAEVCKRFYDSNKQKIEDASHGEHGWSSTELFEEIPYILATQDNDSETSEEEVRLALKILG
jgi:uncharacterized phage-associated protein